MSAAAGGTHVKQYDNLKNLLKGAKSTSGADLFAHLQETFRQLILHYPGEQALDKLEEVSYLLKHQQADGLKITDFLQLEEIHNHSQVAASLQAYIDKIQGPPKKKAGGEGAEGEEGGEPEAAEVGPINNVADIIADQNIYQWAGIGFGEIESWRIQKSLKQLAKESGAGYIRFFGKINGTEKDYFVAEGSLDAGEEEGEKPANQEPRGTGVNKNVYWVTDNLLEKWTRLPDLSPKDILAARQIKVLLTGDLERPIFTNPFFFGKEKHFLRAQISRIIHSSTLVPKGLYKVNEENKREIEDFVPEEGQEVPVPSFQGLGLPESWVHHLPNILNNGRTSHMDPEGLPDDADPEVEKKKIEAQDPYEPRLKAVANDKSIPVGGVGKSQKQIPWSIRSMGDTTDYFNPIKPTKKINNGVIVIRSLQWPGAYTLYHQGRTISIYVGNGLKYEGSTTASAGYFPIFPPKVMSDPAEFKEMPEPTPLFVEEPVKQIDIDSIIDQCIETIWTTYDKDNSGVLEKAETKEFVKITLQETGQSGEFSDQEFDACFQEFDKNGNGTISKDEIKIFIKKVAGL